MHYFKPWIGCDAQSGICGKRILVIGDSHYCGEDCADCGVHGGYYCEGFDDFTLENVGCLYDMSVFNSGGWVNTFKKFSKALAGDKELSHDGFCRLWDHLCFYNFVQTAYKSGPRDSYSNQDYEASLPMFWQVMDDIRPDLVLVWGQKVWNTLPSEGWRYIAPVGAISELGRYEDKFPTATFALVSHPSWPGFSYDEWIPALAGLENAIGINVKEVLR